MKRFLIVATMAMLCLFNADAQKKIPHAVRTNNNSYARRTEIIIPQLKGYNVYKGDFHIHTSYSDGNVTPASRVTEAWYDGLDIISITDHYEGQKGLRNTMKVLAPMNEDGKPTPIPSTSKTGKVWADFNEIHNQAAAQVERSGFPMLLIKGCEMARNAKTHGHYNCLFLKDINGLYNKDMAEAFRNVKKQGGIIIHNHPAWRRKTSDKTEFHNQVYGEGLIDGVEVVNGTTFYPHIVRRCIDEKLTMFANTDEHGLTAYRFGTTDYYRTMTLVMAKDLTEKAVKDAILKRRTIAYSGGCLIGEEEWLNELLNESVVCHVVKEDAKAGKRTYMLTNMSSFTYKLRRGKTIYELEPFKSLQVNFSKDKNSGKYVLPKFTVDNMWIVDYKHPVFEIKLDK